VQVNEAYVMYKRLDKYHKSFTLTHCWQILKDEDKWKAWRQEKLDMQKVGGHNKKNRRLAWTHLQCKIKLTQLEKSRIVKPLVQKNERGQLVLRKLKKLFGEEVAILL
jgi:hypothetical protein